MPEEIVLPDSMQQIGSYAFSGCSETAKVTVSFVSCEIASDATPAEIAVRGRSGSTAQTSATTNGNSAISAAAALTIQ